MVIVQNPLDMVAPLRVSNYPVNESFCSPAVADQKNMLLIIALGPERMEHPPDQIPLQRLHKDINYKEGRYHGTGKVHIVDIFSHQVQNQGKDQKADGVGLADIGKFAPPSLYPLWRIQMEYAVQKQIHQDNGRKRQKIHLGRKGAPLSENPAFNDKIPGQSV